MTVPFNPQHGHGQGQAMTTPIEADKRLHSGRPILIDAHVHLYDCFDRTVFFDAALANIRGAAEALGLPTNTPGYLLLAETRRDEAFESLRKQKDLDGGRWRFRGAGDGLSLIAAHEGEEVLTVIAGRQVVTREGLEVLSLCCAEKFEDGGLAEGVVEQVIALGGLAVLPYGVGKWSGTRGAVVDGLLAGPLGKQLFLGDNAGRLALSGKPKRFIDAQRRGVWVLPGTDPLPFAGQARQAGRFGLVLEGRVDPDRPAESIKHLIASVQRQPAVYGRARGLASFLALQSGMQLRKRLKRS